MPPRTPFGRRVAQQRQALGLRVQNENQANTLQTLEAKEVDPSALPDPDYLTKCQPFISDGARRDVVDWMVTTAVNYDLPTEELFLAVNYLDRFLTNAEPIRADKLKLLAAVCVAVAERLVKDPPFDTYQNYVELCFHRYSRVEFDQWETSLLNILDFHLEMPTPMHFADIYLFRLGGIPNARTHYLTYYLCELTFLEPHIYLRYKISTVAAAAVCLACYVLNRPGWKNAMRQHSNKDMKVVGRLMHIMLTSFKNADHLPHQASTAKYSDNQHYAAALQQPPNRLNNV